MANDVGSLHPNDEKLGAFALLTDFLLKNSVSRTILRTIHYGLFAISPSVPDTFLDLVRRKSTRRAFWWGAGLTFFFCFIVITVWSIVDGTFSGADSTRVYFSKDLTNLLEYILICPVYVGLSVQLIVLVLASYARLCRPTGLAETAAVTLPRTSIGVSAFIVLALSASITINYIKEVLDPRLYPKVGWWVERVTADGTRVLSPLGLYYAILNFSLLSICLTAALAFLALFFLCVRFGKMIGDQPVTNEITFDTIKDMLSTFTSAYVVLKLLAVALVVHVYTWKMWKPETTLSFKLTTTALVIFGVFFISIPRYYIELEWFRFRVRRALALGLQVNLERDDIRPFRVRVLSWMADGAVLSSFLFAYLSASF
jgi:hypothetical protein